MEDTDKKAIVPGMLSKAAGECFPLSVCKSAAGYYIGTRDEEGLPFSRESAEYWKKPDQAEAALQAGRWTQRRSP
jgi:hypothetical protein